MEQPINKDGKVLSPANEEVLKPEQIDVNARNQQAQRADGVELFYDPEVASDQSDSGAGQKDFEQPAIQIDERFAHLDENEAVMRTLQSKADVLQTKIKQYQEQNNQLSNNVSVLQKLAEDKGYARAFLAKYHEDLMPQSDPYQEAEAQLKSEFGEDFMPDEAEAKRNPFGQSGRYFDRVNELYKQIKEKNSDEFSSLDEIIQSQQEQEEQERLAYENEAAQLKAKLGIDDRGLQNAISWGQKLTLSDIVHIHRFVLANQVGNYNQVGNANTAKNVVNPGGSSYGVGGLNSQQLAKLFGPPQSR